MIQKNKGLFTTIGFLLFILGSSALVLSLVGVKFSFLLWLDAAGALVGFIARIVMMVSGIVLATLANTNWEDEDEANVEKS
jgi:glucose uptake protein GlcU